MNIKAWAFEPNEQELSRRNAQRYDQIKHLADQITLHKSPQYARCNFSGTLDTEEAMALSEEDIALIADFGNLCFGGYCEKNGNRFSGAYYTD